MMKINVLAVDDEPQFERLLRQRLRREIRKGKFNLSFALSAEEALGKLRAEGPYDLVLTDINMPEKDGLALLQEIKEQWNNQQVVIVSAYGDMGNIRTAMNLGAYDFITKPIDFEDLKVTIEKTAKGAELIKKGEQAEELAHENERLATIDQLKNEFFTNIAHEFRTPLTVIKGMSEQIDTNAQQWLEKALPLIKNNTRQLLDLVNQVLELRKLASGTLPVHWIQADIIAYLLYIAESYAYLAESKDIQLNIHYPESEFMMDYDADKLLRILSNLVSNAIKFTPAGGSINLRIQPEGKQFIIEVRDTGRGIPREQQKYIFDPFYQSSDKDYQQGTGIGLAIVQQMTQLLGGDASLESTVGEGTTFRVSLPIHQEAPKSKPVLARTKATKTKEEVSSAMPSGDLPTILIVEDNKDIRTYLQVLLEDRYHCLVAEDGEQGWSRLLESVPDLVVTDLMMPRLNGIELCKRLKKDDRVRHIPVIMLTAKDDQDSRLDSLRYGADAYLLKPFEQEELFVQIERLLTQRAQLQEYYQNLALGKEPAKQEAEDDFVLQVRDLVETNLDDEDFGIQDICRSVGVSRTQMHRKLKSITGLSSSHFIRSIRLEHAKKLLQSSELNISQVAFEVGFKDPKYFSRTFSAAFGTSPQDWRQ
ncbi:MAG TPA: response regulator [Saprospiraceae bacterium]|nr:response regulator [Saprospiraceae bacterium]